jgi:hypothetical protein
MPLINSAANSSLTARAPVADVMASTSVLVREISTPRAVVSTHTAGGAIRPAFATRLHVNTATRLVIMDSS